MSFAETLAIKLTAVAVTILLILAMPVEAKPRRHLDTGEDTIKTGQSVRNGWVCKDQIIMVTGKARPTWPVNFAESNARELWSSTVTGIHGERFSDVDQARDFTLTPLKSRFKQKRYVAKGKPCAPSL